MQPNYRAAPQVTIRAETLNEESRTVEAAISSNTPVREWDWERGEDIDTALVPEGFRIRGGADSVPLLNAHNRRDIGDVAGRVSNIRAEGSEVLATVTFDGDDVGTKAMGKVRSGSITDLSVGFSIIEYTYNEDENMRTVSEWELSEVSLVPIGADVMAKFRALATANNNTGDKPEIKPQGEVDNMPQETRETPTPAPDEPKENEQTRNALIEARPLIADPKFIRETLRSVGGTQEQIDTLTDEKPTREQVTERALAIAAERNKPEQRDPSKVEVTRDQTQQFFERASDGILLRAGLKPKGLEGEALKQAESYRSHSLADLARQALVMNGMSERDAIRLSGVQLFTRAFSERKTGPGDNVFVGGQRSFNHTTSDFPLLLADAMNKSLQTAYSVANPTFQRWTSTGTFSDFKSRKVIKLSEGKSPEVVTENGEIPETTLSEAQETYSIETHANMLSITRQTLLNDDLSAFSRLPQIIAGQYIRKQNQAVYSILLTNANMSDGTALFASGHSNLAGSGAAPSVATLQAAFASMAKQTGPDGSILNIMPRFILCPSDIAGTVAQVINSTVDPSKSNSAINPYANTLEVISEPLLGTTWTYNGVTQTGDANAWYLAADPGQVDTVEIGYLNGITNPTIEEMPITNVLGTSFRTYLDFKAKAIDHRGLYKNDGGA